MLQLNNNIDFQKLHSSDSKTYTYKNSNVRIITVFADGENSTALVEDEKGELFEVPRDSLI